MILKVRKARQLSCSCFILTLIVGFFASSVQSQSGWVYSTARHVNARSLRYFIRSV